MFRMKKRWRKEAAMLMACILGALGVNSSATLAPRGSSPRHGSLQPRVPRGKEEEEKTWTAAAARARRHGRGGCGVEAEPRVTPHLPRLLPMWSSVFSIHGILLPFASSCLRPAMRAVAARWRQMRRRRAGARR